MDFFQAQDDAKRKTGLLILLFIAATFGLIVVAYAIVMALQAYLTIQPNQFYTLALIGQQFDWQQAIMVACVVSLIIFSGSAYKTLSLGSGGKKVAELLGGQRISYDTRDSKEKQLLNIVDEMAIASGSPVPAVYLLHNELGINAFAAGYRASDAVIGVTQGCLEQLTRDELQGVIAHEFSHILHGDTRLNMRLIGILHGILLIGYIGYYILRSVRGNNKNTAALFALGLGLIAVGFSGNFFGGLIKAAVSRQREYLADASAVQYTRSKDGIAGALTKIKNNPYGSTLDSPLAPQMSHAYFSQGVSSFVDSLFSTHPPLQKRIKRIAPYFELQNKIHNQKAKPQAAKSESTSSQQKSMTKEAIAKGVAGVVVAEQVLDSIGNISQQHLDYAHQLLIDVPSNILDSVRTVTGAQAFIYCLLLDSDKFIQEEQLKELHGLCEQEVFDTVLSIYRAVLRLHPRFRLPLIDISLPLLQALNKTQYQHLLNTMQMLIDCDHHFALFEWVLKRMVVRHLGASFEKANRVDKSLSIEQCQHQAEVLFSTLLYYLVDDNLERHQVLLEVRTITSMPKLRFLSVEQCQFSELDNALMTLVQLQVKSKPDILRGCLLIATCDKRFSHQEMELIRAIADTLDCPMPPTLSAS
ncbi:M48 family metallopeptidase [Thalassotalea aquiviva]|uniref:M48 family metallopeptidase n=1 Tax=Thalassotalea aquiviva TaxID=3242415 RepID=UPI00352A537B